MEGPLGVVHKAADVEPGRLAVCMVMCMVFRAAIRAMAAFIFMVVVMVMLLLLLKPADLLHPARGGLCCLPVKAAGVQDSADRHSAVLAGEDTG